MPEIMQTSRSHHHSPRAYETRLTLNHEVCGCLLSLGKEAGGMDLAE